MDPATFLVDAGKWLYEERTWLFEGSGIWILGGIGAFLGWLLAWLWRRLRKKSAEAAAGTESEKTVINNSGMSITGAQFEQLNNVLLSAFDDAGLEHLCAFELEVDFGAIAAPGSRTERVFRLIRWAQGSGRIIGLIAGALHQNPTNTEVRSLALAAMTWPACAKSGDALFIRDKPATRREEEAYLTGLIAKYKEWEQKYTPLAGVAQVEGRRDKPPSVVSPVFMPTGFEKLVERGFGMEKRVERVPVDDLRHAVTEYRRLVVLGEPGAGKTTTLWRLVYDYAAAAKDDPKAPIPVIVALGGYTGPESALAYAAQYAGELGLHLPVYIAGGRLVLLLDAMNEMPRDGYEERVGRIQALLEGGPSMPVVVTCRALDYREDLKLEKVDVKSLDVCHQREYLHRYLGHDKGEKLFWEMAGGDTVIDLWGACRQRGMTFEQFWTSKNLPEDVERTLTWVQRSAWRQLNRDNLPPLLALGVNPFLLVMFAEVYLSAGALPQNRATLFAAFVDTLLEREHQRHAQNWPGASVLTQAYAALAYAMQESGQRGTSVARDWAAKRLRSAGLDPESALYLGTSATLLFVADDQVRFVHQLIQEYFAAVAWQGRYAGYNVSRNQSNGWRAVLRAWLARLRGGDLRRFWPQGWTTPSGWEETAVLLAGLLPDMTAFLKQLLPANPPLAARCIAESGGALPAIETINAVQASLVEIAASLAPVKERNAAGNALNYLEDPRPGVGVKDGVPDIVWCPVPAGPFLMGNTKKTDSMAYDDEMPQHSVNLAAFAISKYPITNAQYQAFIDAGGYTERRQSCWTAAGWQWKERNSIGGPRRFGADFDAANHPVVGVSWYEAVAFCGWLTAKLGRSIMLPTEAQWEKAARGTDGWRYPWGPEITPEHANYVETHIGATSPVGIFAKGESPYHLLDAAGNVWEWTKTKWAGSYEPYRPDDDLEGDAPRALRGGAWYYYVDFVRCAYRVGDLPHVRSNFVGFRVVSPGS